MRYAGEDIDLTVTDDDGNTAVHLAADKGMIWVVRKLLSRGANPNAVNHAGDTPLHMAARGGVVTIWNALEQNGASGDAVNNEGRTPRDEAG